MNKFKLTNKNSYLICGIVQFLIGILYFVWLKKDVSFLIIFTFLGIALILIPYLKPTKIKRKKFDKAIGILLFCSGILSFLLVPSDSSFLLILDAGLINLII